MIERGGAAAISERGILALGTFYPMILRLVFLPDFTVAAVSKRPCPKARDLVIMLEALQLARWVV